MDYLHYKVIHQRLKEISDSEGVTLSYLIQKAIEQYLYGESGSITDDPYFEKFIGENNITQAWRFLPEVRLLFGRLIIFR